MGLLPLDQAIPSYEKASKRHESRLQTRKQVTAGYENLPVDQLVVHEERLELSRCYPPEPKATARRRSMARLATFPGEHLLEDVVPPRRDGELVSHVLRATLANFSRYEQGCKFVGAGVPFVCFVRYQLTSRCQCDSAMPITTR